MASQNSSAPASRSLNMESKVNASGGKAQLTKSQPITGKLGGGMSAMPGSKSLGQSVKTVPSNPISGKANVQPGNTAMGSGPVINGFV